MKVQLVPAVVGAVNIAAKGLVIEIANKRVVAPSVEVGKHVIRDEEVFVVGREVGTDRDAVYHHERSFAIVEAAVGCVCFHHVAIVIYDRENNKYVMSRCILSFVIYTQPKAGGAISFLMML